MAKLSTIADPTELIVKPGVKMRLFNQEPKRSVSVMNKPNPNQSMATEKNNNSSLVS